MSHPDGLETEPFSTSSSPPISNINHESDCSRCCGTGETPPAGDCPPCQPKSAHADSRHDWSNQLQLWTLEPVDLRAVQIPECH